MPSSSSWMTMFAPAAPKDFLTSTSSMARSACAMSRQIKTPLPSARPSALTAQRPPREAAKREAEGESAKVPARAVGMPYCSMKRCENTLEASNRAACWFGPQMRSPCLLEQVHDAERQGIVRADDGEVGVVLPGEGQEGGQVFGAKVDALDQGAVLGQAFLRDAGIAGRAPEAGDVGRLRQLPNQGVFAAAGANDQNLHRRRLNQEPARTPKEFA